MNLFVFFLRKKIVYLLGGYDIKIKDFLNLDYMVVFEYILFVSCFD